GAARMVPAKIARRTAHALTRTGVHWHCPCGERDPYGGGSAKACADRTEGGASMIRRSRWLWVSPACLVAMALLCGTAGAADKTNVNRATKQVDQGAKQIGRGNVGPGFK